MSELLSSASSLTVIHRQSHFYSFFFFFFFKCDLIIGLAERQGKYSALLFSEFYHYFPVHREFSTAAVPSSLRNRAGRAHSRAPGPPGPEVHALIHPPHRPPAPANQRCLCGPFLPRAFPTRSFPFAFRFPLRFYRALRLPWDFPSLRSSSRLTFILTSRRKPLRLKTSPQNLPFPHQTSLHSSSWCAALRRGPSRVAVRPRSASAAHQPPAAGQHSDPLSGGLR